MKRIFPLLMLSLMFLQTAVFADPSAGSFAVHDRVQAQGSSLGDSDVNLNVANDVNIHTEQSVMNNSSTYLNSYYNWAHAQYGSDSLGARLPQDH